jgi:hypothetical protein
VIAMPRNRPLPPPFVHSLAAGRQLALHTRLYADSLRERAQESRAALVVTHAAVVKSRALLSSRGRRQV